jgi:hypothetical protein
MYTHNILKVYNKADKIDITEGMQAYTNYNKLLKRIASKYNTGFVQVVAAFVSLSPNNDYVGNLRSLVTLLEGIRTHKTLDRINCTTYRSCLERAYSYVTGEKDFLMCTKGPKITAFYYNIIDQSNTKFVTVDGHMHSVLTGKVLTMKEAVRTKIKYHEATEALQKVAKQLSILPCQLQAILWFTHKRVNNIVYSAHGNLFKQEDYWGLDLEVNSIKLLPWLN